MSKTHYELLQISPNADLETIKQAYRRLMRQHHPDNYAAELTRLRQNGDQGAIKRLEIKIEHAKKLTQALNIAYDTLCDAQAKTRYDRQLEEARHAARMTIDPDYRPPRRPTAAQVQATRHSASQTGASAATVVPWVLIGGLIVALIGVFWFVSAILIGRPIGGPAIPGAASAYELQETANARQATRIARTQAALEPTATPLSLSDWVRAGDTFYAARHYDLALDAYKEALSLAPQNPTLYYKRLRTRAALFWHGLQLNPMLSS